MFIGPVYYLKNNGVTIATAITVLQLLAGSGGPVEVLRASLSQSTSTTSAQVAAGLIRKSAAATVTAAVAGTTLLKGNPVAPASNATLSTSGTGITATVEGTNGELTTQRGFNVLNGYEWLPTPEERVLAPQAGILGLTFFGTPPSATWYGEIVYRELRGG
jgi:hypothetical protein